MKATLVIFFGGMLLSSTYGAVLTVTSASDDGAASLRQAIRNANLTPEADRIVFNITVRPGVRARIPLTSPLPVITRSLDIDATMQAGGTVELDGSTAGTGADGLRIQATGCEIRGLVINRFSGDGIEISAPGRSAWIRECFIGTSNTGLSDYGNGGHGVHINNSPNNVVGAMRVRSRLELIQPHRNVISGNGGSGVYISGSAAINNNVSGNFIGVNGSGSAALGNSGNGVTITGGALGNLIGAIAKETQNVISGNLGQGIEISSVGIQEVRTLSSTDVPKTVPLWIGNVIGEVSSQLTVTEWFSVLDLDVQAHLTHNPISDESLTLVSPEGARYEFERGEAGLVFGDTYLNTTWDDEGGFIGYAAAPYSGRYFPIGRGFSRYDQHSPQGLWQLVVRNVDKTNEAVLHSWSLKITTIPGNIVSGNHIGVDTTGLVDVGNGRNGVLLNGSPGNLVGGQGGLERNVISGNGNDGVYVSGAAAVGNVISGNLIGLAADGVTSLGNTFSGVAIFGGVNNMVGGAVAGSGNVISGNGFVGVILAAAARENTVRGNLIGLGSDGVSARGNGADGVRIEGRSNNNRIGGVTANQSYMIIPFGGNTIAFNQGAGVLVTSFGGDSVGNAIRANSIYSNVGLGINLSRDLPADGVTTGSRFEFDFGGRTGPNQLRNVPELDPYFSGLYVEGYVRNTGAVNPDVWGSTFFVDFFTSPETDGSGYGEGKTFLGSVSLLVSEDGVFDLRENVSEAYLLFTPTPGEYITATSTDFAGNTSEFSAAGLIHANAGVTVNWRSSAASPYGGAVELDKPFHYFTRVLNGGPSIATNVWLTNTLPESMELQGFEITQGTCTNIGNLVICDVGSVLVGSNAAVTLTMEVVPRMEGFFTNAASVSSPNIPGGVRDAFRGPYNWVGRPVPTVHTIVGTNLVISGSTNQMPGVLQVATNLTPPVAWANTLISYQRVSSNWQFNIPLSSTNRFFRTMIRNRLP